MTYHWIGVALGILGAAAVAVSTFYASHAPAALLFVGTVSIALSAPLISTPRVLNRQKGSQEEDIRIEKKWHTYPFQSDRFLVENQTEAVTTSTGSAFIQRFKLSSRESRDLAAEFAVIKLYEGGYWKFGSASELYSGDRRPVELDQQIQSQRIVELLSHVNTVLCLGLASSAEGESDNAAGLSNRRAMRLAEWVRYATVMRERDILVQAVPMGGARTAFKKDSREEKGQRTAILIGLEFDADLISERTAFEELSRLTLLESVRLDDYPSVLRPGV